MLATRTMLSKAARMISGALPLAATEAPLTVGERVAVPFLAVGLVVFGGIETESFVGLGEAELFALVVLGDGLFVAAAAFGVGVIFAEAVAFGELVDLGEVMVGLAAVAILFALLGVTLLVQNQPSPTRA
jgi:hypothetical protein